MTTLYKELRSLMHEKCGRPGTGRVVFGAPPGGKHRLGRPHVSVGFIEQPSRDLDILVALGLPYALCNNEGEDLRFQLEDDAAVVFAQLCLDHKLIPTWKRIYAYEMIHDNSI